MQVKTRIKQKQGMDEDIESLVQNQNLNLVNFPTRKITLQNKWVSMVKEEFGGNK